MTVSDNIRILLTIVLLVVLAALGLWVWFWGALALAVFSEGFALGYKFLERKR